MSAPAKLCQLVAGDTAERQLHFGLCGTALPQMGIAHQQNIGALLNAVVMQQFSDQLRAYSGRITWNDRNLLA
jgi:hypothetical protein